jgi:hypothetical protein
MTNKRTDSTVLYYNRGTSNYVRLLVSIFSLRNHYWGSITVMQEGPIREEIAELLRRLEVQVQFVPIYAADRIQIRKVSLWRNLQHEYAMFIDADTIVRGPVDDFFEWTHKWGFVATWFSGWKTTDTPIKERIMQWSAVDPELVNPALTYGRAVNTGVQGWHKNAAILPACEALSRRGSECNINKRVLDEIALQLLLPSHKHHLAHFRWNTSGIYGNVNKAIIIHYHGRKHCNDNPRCDIWKRHYFELLASFPRLVRALRNPWGDTRLRVYLRGLNQQRSDITIVTAVNQPYAARLRRNVKKWLNTPGLAKQRFIILSNGLDGIQQNWFNKFPNVTIIPWDYSHKDASVREFMLAAFIFGAAKHVKTKYWMKLDADCKPKRPWWEWPKYAHHTIVSHRWRYTLIKDNDNVQHWFNRLDDIFSPDKPLFCARLDTVVHMRLSHLPGNPQHLPMRFNSFCHIEKTSFTRRIVARLNSHNNGRMAIPSQDTTSWYCSQLWGEDILLTNMRKWFGP